MLAELDALPATGSDDAPVTAQPVDAPDEDAEPVADAPEPDTEAVEAPEPAPEPAKVDGETAKRLAQVQKATERAQAKLTAERAELDKLRADLEPRSKAFADYEALMKRAKYDPAALLEHAGYSQDDFEHAARALYARSKAAENDPKTKAAAMQSAKEREYADKLSQTEQRMADLEQSIQSERQQVVQQRQVTEWMDGVTKTVSEDAPLLRASLAKAPDKAKAALAQIALRIHAETGEMPDGPDLHAAYEAQRRAELEDLGIDVASVVKAKKPAAATPTGRTRTIPAEAGTATVPPAKEPPTETREEKRTRMVRELEALDRPSA